MADTTMYQKRVKVAYQHMLPKWRGYVHYCGYKNASVKPQSLAKFFHRCEQHDNQIHALH